MYFRYHLLLYNVVWANWEADKVVKPFEITLDGVGACSCFMSGNLTCTREAANCNRVVPMSKFPAFKYHVVPRGVASSRV